MRQRFGRFGAVHHFANADRGFDIDARMIAPLHLILSSNLSDAPHSSTATSFQARLAASRIPVHMPCPRNGGIRCAASPAINRRPAPSGRQLGFEAVNGLALDHAVLRRDGQAEASAI